MKGLLLLSFSLILFSATAQQGTDIIIGKRDSIHSSILKENRNYLVYLPPSYSAQDKKTKFPVLYLLDGDAHFHSVTGLIHQLATGVNGNTLFPEMIVVAIPNTDRTRDLTPIADKLGPDGKEMPFLKTSGGGENFTSFLQKELIPQIEQKYNTAPFRLLIGHSFGGITVMNILLNHTDLFNAYVAIDPSMWWAKGALLKQAEKTLAIKTFNSKTLFLSIANTMPAGMQVSAVDKDTTPATEHIRSIRTLENLLKKNTVNGLRWTSMYFNEDDHGSVPLISEYHALRFIFEGYKMNEATATAGIDSLTAHYTKVSEMLGYTIQPPENLVNGIGYLYLQAKEIDKAIQHFQLNVNNYPNSANVYDSLGDAYLEKGDKAKAKEQFQKALQIDPGYDTSMQKLKELMK